MIYLDYFWYIKYQHISIYMKMGKGNGKRKRKREKQLAGPGGGDFGPSGRESVRAGALAAQLRPTGGETARARGSDGVTAGPTRQRERRRETAPRVDGAGEPAVRGERKTGRRWARRRFTAGGPVLGPRGGGLAWAGAGDPRGRLNLARGAGRGLSVGRWRSFAAGITTGGLWARDWGGEVVL